MNNEQQRMPYKRVNWVRKKSTKLKCYDNAYEMLRQVQFSTRIMRSGFMKAISELGSSGQMMV